jgi:Endonuclease-reverse transcriptase
MKSKIDVLEFNIACMSELPDIILVTETWFDESVILSGYLSRVYSIMRKDRNRHGGGVLLMVKSELKADLVDNNSSIIEDVWCTFTVDKEKFLFGVIYRPPNNDEAYLFSVMNSISFMCQNYDNHNIIISGDFNFPSIDWEIPCPQQNDKLANEFIDCILSNSLDQIVTFPTRSNNILDLVFCKNFPHLPQAECVIPLVSSDHESIKFTFDVPNTSYKSKLKKTNRLNFRKTDFNSLNNFLLNTNWFLLFSQYNNVEEVWGVFIQVLYDGINLFVPVLRTNYSKHRVIIPKLIKRLINKKNKAWRLFQRTRSVAARNKFLCISKQCKFKIKENVRNKISSLCLNRNTKRFYNFVNSSIGRDNPQIYIKSNDNKTVLSDFDAAQEFASFFHSIYSKDDGILPPFPPQIQDLFDHIGFSADEVKNYLQRLPNKYSSGPDKIPTVLLKKLSSALSVPLALLFQRSLEQGVLPKIWKHANVIPIFKGKGNKFDVKNFRPLA